jgi:hypothetical protein
MEEGWRGEDGEEKTSRGERGKSWPGGFLGRVTFHREPVSSFCTAAPRIFRPEIVSESGNLICEKRADGAHCRSEVLRRPGMRLETGKYLRLFLSTPPDTIVERITPLDRFSAFAALFHPFFLLYPPPNLSTLLHPLQIT